MGDIGVDEIDLKIGCGLDACGLGWVPVAGCCEHGSNPSYPMKDMVFDYLSDKFIELIKPKHMG